jgi:hypothetical protein
MVNVKRLLTWKDCMSNSSSLKECSPSEETLSPILGIIDF